MIFIDTVQGRYTVKEVTNTTICMGISPPSQPYKWPKNTARLKGNQITVETKKVTVKLKAPL
ncbi:MAG: hypothetical protein R6T91_03025 [Bacteroidales bacterium]